MKRPPLKNVAVLGVAAVLAALGSYNIFLKATWTLMDDGVLWVQGAQGVYAARVAPGGPAAQAGIHVNDIVLALDGEEVLTSQQIETHLSRRPPGAHLVYDLLRADERRPLEVTVKPLSQGNVSLFYYLSLVGFFSLLVGTIVMLRRPPDRAALHFYAICLLFFLMYSTSYTGKLNLADWTLLWTDTLSILFLPVVFLHFCLAFPERRSSARAWVIPAAYMPALALAGAAVASQVLFVTSPPAHREVLWQVTSFIDNWKPIYFATLFAVSFGILLGSYRRTRSLTARKQMKWLVWGTGAGVMPFFLFYAIPFALGREPRQAMELAGYIPLALIPLSLAYAVVKHRLMDVELIFRRTLVYILALAAILGMCLLAVNLFQVLIASEQEPHVTVIAILSTLVVALLFSPVKNRIQEGIDRLFFRERYNSRRALLRLSQDLNADLDLGRMAERLLQGVHDALGVSSLALFLPHDDGGFWIFKDLGCTPAACLAHLPPGGSLVKALAAGEPVLAEAHAELYPEAGPLDLSHYFPCRVKGEIIAILGVGRKEMFDPLNSEEVDVLQALAGQAATAVMNGRLYHSLREKANELQELTEYNENIIESMDSGILVLNLDGKVVRWNRAMEGLYRRQRDEVLGHSLDEIFPEAFLEALRGSLVLGRNEEIANIYKLHLPCNDGRALRVNVSVAPFKVGSGERCGTIIIVDDVTVRMGLEEQLQHSEKMASIGILAAGVAHEVNTPLTGISSYTQMLRQQIKNDDPRSALLEKIEKQTFRAAKIVNNLLNFSRSSKAEFENLDTNKVLLDVLSLLEHQLERGRIKVRKELNDLPLVRGNENRLQQVFFNLILNARDAMPKGGWLTLATRAEDDAVVVEVRDTGHGIKPEHVRRIYDP
ncbi:MAG TPA: histidine kinase dimerization/phospho-acceptor domain-containing protein, partial [Vicinamibacteria bacterium]|nr:histidine kinase dimerization/phospho-acceptor domain-containing protein [Vicinamibacteria bacterium]